MNTETPYRPPFKQFQKPKFVEPSVVLEEEDADGDKEQDESTITLQTESSPETLQTESTPKTLELESSPETLQTESTPKTAETEPSQKTLELKSTPEKKDTSFLYPQLDDPNFNTKLSVKKEFYETQYDGTIANNIEERANAICDARFELSPQQLFVKNFLSMQTPYRSLLLYHGLGTGKTCSAIGVAEEMRKYAKKTGSNKKILIVASPSLQKNFLLQLFDPSKLQSFKTTTNNEQILKSLSSCVGPSLLEEINPTNFHNVDVPFVIRSINAIVRQFFEFKGYIEFKNYVQEIANRNRPLAEEGRESEESKKAREKQNICEVFNDRLVIVDEVHNLRVTDDVATNDLEQNVEGVRVGEALLQVATLSDSMRLLLLTATPMYNSQNEIVFLANLLNANDNRPQIAQSDVFQKNGNFKKKTRAGTEDGESLLRRKLTGYVSFVRGENPYSFPFRVYPSLFAPNNVINKYPYPKKQMNGQLLAPDVPKITRLQLFINDASTETHQIKTYLALTSMEQKAPSNMAIEDDEMDKLTAVAYAKLQKPIQALNMVYPNVSSTLQVSNLLGQVGALSTLSVNKYADHVLFDYKTTTLASAGRVFHPDNIGHYSHKIARITKEILQSEGIVLVFSQYVYGGIVPMALALEEMGYCRHTYALKGEKSLFSVPPQTPKRGNYIIVCGDGMLSPSITEDVRHASAAENKDGSKVKVILMSVAGTEGLDFKNIRQVHVMDPWFNMSRIEQTIGRAVRHKSHCLLSFSKRNVQIFLHGTILKTGANEFHEEEAADLYMYRFAEKKAVAIGKVARVIKESATDCILNIAQTNFTFANFQPVLAEHPIRLELSSLEEKEGTLQPKIVDNFAVGDLDGTEMCDYMTCAFQCKPSLNLQKDVPEPDARSYSVENATGNAHYIESRIRELFLEGYQYSLDHIVRTVNAIKSHPIESILFALSSFANNRSNVLYDARGRKGRLVNRGTFYAFQPLEITDVRVSNDERSRPLDIKPKEVVLLTTKETVPPARVLSVPAVVASAPPTRDGDYVAILNDIQTKLANHTLSTAKDSWYKYLHDLRQPLEQDFHIDSEELIQFAVDHYIETVSFQTKRTALNHWNDDVPAHHRPFHSAVRNHFQQNMALDVELGTPVLLLADDDDHVQVMRWESPTWNAYRLDNRPEQPLVEKYAVDKQTLNSIVGYIWHSKGKDRVFYYKDIDIAKNTQGRFVQDKKHVLETMEKANMGTQSGLKKPLNKYKLYELNVLLEIIFRKKQVDRDTNRVYFLTPEQVIFNDILHFSRP